MVLEGKKVDKNASSPNDPKKKQLKNSLFAEHKKKNSEIAEQLIQRVLALHTNHEEEFTK